MARGRFGFFLLAAVLCAGGPVAVLAQTTHLMVTKSGNGVVFARAPRVQRSWQASRRLPPPLPDALRGMVHSRAMRAGGAKGSPAVAGAPLAAPEESRAPAVFAEVSPSPEAPDPVGLTVTKTWNAAKNNWNLNMAWSGSAGPFDLVYAPAPTFQSGVATLAKQTAATSFSRLAIPGAPLECYEVADTTISGEAVQGMGYTPEPAPAVPSASGDGLWWGDSVTFTSNYLDPIAKGNVMLMYDRAVRATGTNAVPGGRYATTAAFTIPDDARGFNPFLSVHGRSSSNQGAPFISLYPKGIGPYTNIHGIAYAPQTGWVWVAADGIIQNVNIFRTLPGVVTTISTLAKPYISKVTTGGNMLYVNGVSGVAAIYQTASATPYASTTDSGFTRPIRPVGIAVEPDGSACYIADANLGRVVRIPANNATAITDNWGAYTWSFPDPCGMDAYAGLVFVGSTGAPPWIGEITDAASTYLYEYAQAVPYGIEIERDISTASQIYYIYAGDPGIAEAYNKNGIEDVAGTPVRNHGALLFGLANGRLAVSPDWDYFVYHHWPQRVVVNNSGQNEAYPSSFQQFDQIIRLDIAGWPGRYEQVCVIDPPDLSPYAPDAGWCGTTGYPACTAALPYEGNDNYGADFGLSNSPSGPWTATVKLRPGQDNIPPDTTSNLTLYLKVPARYSGNNFQAEVTKCDAYGNPMPTKVTGLSSVYTAWKRVYVERDSMFRRGGVLDPDKGSFPSNYALPDNQIALDLTNQNLYCTAGTPPCPCTSLPCPSANIPITVFDAAHPYGYGTDQSRTITLLESYTLDGKPILRATLDSALSRTIGGQTVSYIAGFANPLTQMSAGVGSVAGCDPALNRVPNAANSCFYDPDMRDIEQPFDDGYVEFIGLRSGMGAVPYLPKSFFDNPSPAPQVLFSRIWFSHWTTDPGNALHCQENNYFHLLGASESSSVLGLTTSSANTSYVFVQGVANNSNPGADFIAYCQEVSDHEPTHQWDVNWCNCDLHDTNNAWCALFGNCATSGLLYTEACLMNMAAATPPSGNPAQLIDGVNRLCTTDLLLGSSGCTNLSCPDGTMRNAAPGYGAVRTMPDPW